MRMAVYRLLLAVSVCAAVASAAQSLDTLVTERLRADGISPAAICSDEVFVRRVFLDAIGTLPTTREAREFLSSTKPDKRKELINYLLEREEFADYRALKWCDLLRVKAEFPSNLWPNAVQAYHYWIRDALRRNVPYDELVREILTASGSNFRDPAVNFFRPFQDRSPHNILDMTALVFMGVRLNSSGWTEGEILGMEAFFSKIAYKKTAEWKEEIIYFDPQKEFFYPDSEEPVVPTFPDGQTVELGLFQDPRIAFADWLTSPENPWFAGNIVNRIWYRLLGRGIIHEVDDIRPDNPPWSPDLLAFLESELIRSDYDLKHIYRLILNSDTYQRSAPFGGDVSEGEAAFAHYRIRRMDAEVLIDAVCQITGVGEEYSSAIPEPFTFVPRTERTIRLADGSIKSPFLELFGRPGRDTSLVSDRDNRLSVFQALHMLNSSHIQDKILNGWRLKRLIERNAPVPNLIDDIYLTVLSRYPTREERAFAVEYVESGGLGRVQSLQDVTWALVNSSEFILKH